MRTRRFSLLRRRASVDAAIAAYRTWTSECAAVHDAYRTWLRAPSSGADAAFDAYEAALEREERAAHVYARHLRRARRQHDIDVARQLAQLSG